MASQRLTFLFCALLLFLLLLLLLLLLLGPCHRLGLALLDERLLLLSND